MAQQPSPSEGARSGPRKRDGAKKRAPIVFAALFKALEVLGQVLDVVNGVKDLF